MPPQQQTNQTNQVPAPAPAQVPVATIQSAGMPDYGSANTPDPMAPPNLAPIEKPHDGMMLSSSQQKIMKERHRGSVGLVLTVIAVITLIIFGATFGVEYVKHLLNTVHTYSG